MPEPLSNEEALLTDAQLRRSVDRNETLASCSGYVLVGGLVIEVALALKFATGFPTIDELLSPIATALVLLGVYGEIHFAGRAARAQKALLARTDERLTQALNRATQSERELIDFRRPRRRLMTQENRALLLQKLSPFAGQEFDVGFGSGGEQIHFVWDLEEVLSQAQWRQLPWGVAAVGTLTHMRNLRPLAGAIHAENVEIQLEPTWRHANLAAAEALIASLNEIGIAASETPFNFANTNVQAIHLLVGPKG